MMNSFRVRLLHRTTSKPVKISYSPFLWNSVQMLLDLWKVGTNLKQVLVCFPTLRQTLLLAKYIQKNRVSASLVFILFDIFELLFEFEGSVRFKLVPERLMATNLFKQTSTVARVDNSWSLKVWNYRPETQEKLWHIKLNVFAFPLLLLLTAPTEFPKEGRHFCLQAVVMLRLGPDIEARPSSNSGRCERSLNLKKTYKGTK